MSRFLFVVPPMAGHVNPTLAVGRELAARGHEVAWAGPEEVVAELMPREATFVPVPLAPGVRDHIAARADDLRGAPDWQAATDRPGSLRCRTCRTSG